MISGTDTTSSQAPKTQGQEGGSSTSQPPGAAGTAGAQGGALDEETRRLAEEASRLMEAARTEVVLDEESSKRDAAIADRLAQLQSQQPSSNSQTSGYHLHYHIISSVSYCSDYWSRINNISGKIHIQWIQISAFSLLNKCHDWRQ